MRIVILITLAITNIFLAAHVMAYLWGLFAVPLGAPAIGPAMAYGILLLLQAPHAASAMSSAIMLNHLVPKTNRDETMMAAAVAQTAMWLMIAIFASIAALYI